jgi:hypothetical protein
MLLRIRFIGSKMRFEYGRDGNKPEGKGDLMARGASAALAALLVLAFAGPAAAATPQTIYKDLADNGRLDRHYSQRDINRALHTSSLRRYQLDSSSAQPAPKPLVVPAQSSPEKSKAIPFTGIDLALFVAVGGPLLLLGAGLGRVVRLREQELPS